MSTYFGQVVGKRSRKNAGYEASMEMHTKRLKKFRPDMWRAEIEEEEAEIEELRKVTSPLDRMIKDAGEAVFNLQKEIEAGQETVMEWLKHREAKKAIKKSKKMAKKESRIFNNPFAELAKGK